MASQKTKVIEHLFDKYWDEASGSLICARNGVKSKSETYLTNYVTENTEVDQIAGSGEAGSDDFTAIQAMAPPIMSTAKPAARISVEGPRRLEEASEDLSPGVVAGLSSSVERAFRS